MLDIEDRDRVRILRLDRPEAMNAFNEALYDATAEALIDAAADPGVAVVLFTGTGRAFTTGTDTTEMAQMVMDSDFQHGKHGFPGLVDQFAAFPKPLVMAVNGMALGAGVTLLGYADLVLMSTQARVRCPFTDLAVAPEAASSVLLPALLGRQEAAWLLMSSEWFDADACLRMGLAWRLCEPDALFDEAFGVAAHLAAKPLASLVEVKRTMIAGQRDVIAAARAREDEAFRRLMGSPANLEAFMALAQRRTPEFARVDAEHPVDVARHASD